MTQYQTNDNLTFTREMRKVYCNKCNEQIYRCSECNDSFGRILLPNLPYYEHEEMIECKGGKHICLQCIQKRVIAEMEKEKK